MMRPIASVGVENIGLEQIEGVLAQQREYAEFLERHGLTKAGGDILLRVAWSLANGKKPCVTDICLLVDYPRTTALRYIAMLEEQALIQRERDVHDRRRWLVNLTPKGSTAIQRHLRTS
ncbi:MarR family winged helix-turn-helix transcriptional regulator [Parasphingopyxis sp.]|uniref:MarR family winged helix-turn-helix transcriptional regulator n=1 Tax=Parasphingopyxis sp. TaxID=1920299 RepID=UPI0026300501|nr:MarR family winged helix-turn-helix transcriptional regulator [Parasphingopyxis sp.]